VALPDDDDGGESEGGSGGGDTGAAAAGLLPARAPHYNPRVTLPPTLTPNATPVTSRRPSGGDFGAVAPAPAPAAPPASTASAPLPPPPLPQALAPAPLPPPPPASYDASSDAEFLFSLRVELGRGRTERHAPPFTHAHTRSARGNASRTPCVSLPLLPLLFTHSRSSSPHAAWMCARVTTPLRWRPASAPRTRCRLEALHPSKK
jgi:hypothetical protein